MKRENFIKHFLICVLAMLSATYFLDNASGEKRELMPVIAKNTLAIAKVSLNTATIESNPVPEKITNQEVTIQQNTTVAPKQEQNYAPTTEETTTKDKNSAKKKDKVKSASTKKKSSKKTQVSQAKKPVLNAKNDSPKDIDAKIKRLLEPEKYAEPVESEPEPVKFAEKIKDIKSIKKGKPTVKKITTIPILNYTTPELSAGAQYDSLNKHILASAKVTQKINSNIAGSVTAEYGKNANRMSGTLGLAIRDNQFVKITAERLSEKVIFNFMSGSIVKRIPQYAYGVAYKYIFAGKIISSVNFGGYHAKVMNKALGTIVYRVNGDTRTNQRNITGPISRGISIGFDSMPWSNTSLRADLNYDQIRYNPVYNLRETLKNRSGFGFSANLTQLLSQNVKLDLSVNKREIYDNYDVSYSWLSPFFSRLETSFSVGRIVMHNTMPSKTSYRVNVKLYLDNIHTSNYYSAVLNNYTDLLYWTGTPAVRMARVLAAVDEAVLGEFFVTGIVPNSGPTAGGTAVTITGSGFSTATGVTFGGVDATGVVVLSDTTINAMTPAHAAGVVDAVVLNSSGTGTLTNGYTYIATATPLPVVSSVTPSQGSTAGGTSVTISGSGFSGATAVTFGGTSVTSFTVMNDTVINAVTPAHAVGAVNVVVTTPAGSGVLLNGYTYVTGPAPTSITPTSGLTTGGYSAVILGSGFTGATGVTFGGVNAPISATVLDTAITVTVPAGTAGNVPVVVTNAIGSGTVPGGFTYVSVPPALLPPVPVLITPSSGTTAGGTGVTITGVNFTGTTGVTFDGVAATAVVVGSDISITCTTPAHIAGAVNVVVTNTAGSSTIPLTYTYVAAPAPTSILPTSGLTTGGTSAVITGTNFTGTTSVTFGGTAATIVTVTDTSVSVLTPAHAAGVVNVALTNSTGTGTLTGAYTYVAPPLVGSITPNFGLRTGLVPVVISGSGFTGATSVTFGGTAATSFIVVNDTTITAVTPAHAPGVVNVVVVNPVLGNTTVIGGFTYL